MGGRTVRVIGLLLLGGCGGGGELADETLRRTAEQALDSTSASHAPVDSGFRLPVFVGEVPPGGATPDSTAPPAAAAQWTEGVVERRGGGATVTTVHDLRVGRNEGFDRLVIDFGSSPVPAHRVEYVVPPVRACGTGEPVPLSGRAALLVQLRMTQAHDQEGRVTVARPELRPELPVLKHVAIACDFEGEVAVAVGVTRSVRYRTLVEGSPNRLIVDLQQ